MPRRFSLSSGGYKAMRDRHRNKATIYLAVAVLSFTGFGCKNEEKPKLATAPPPPQSVIGVTATPNGIELRTPAASFTLSPSGALTGVLQTGAASLTLDHTPPKSGQTISIAKKEYAGAPLDQSHADVRNVTGKLGSLGKQVTARGQVEGASLEEAITVEVYDAFPRLALLSITLRNTGETAISLDAVTLQRHTFTSPRNSQGTPPLWMFDGASLKWGKDEILPVPAQYSEENPFGAPVSVKDDLGHVGGGIPVVAFWSQSVGEAIGHVDTLPLALSLPVKTSEAGRVAAAVRISANITLK